MVIPCEYNPADACWCPSLVWFSSTYSHTHARMHSCTHSLTRSLKSSLFHAFSLFTHSCMHSLAHLFTDTSMPLSSSPFSAPSSLFLSQVKCGDRYEDAAIQRFDTCAVTENKCVPTKADTGQYPAPCPDAISPTFNTEEMNGRWYITAGQNPIFDIFPCQEHFFTSTGPGKFYGKLNWRVQKPDGRFLTRSAIQSFEQDPAQPGILYNHNNEYCLSPPPDFLIACLRFSTPPLCPISGVPPSVPLPPSPYLLLCTWPLPFRVFLTTFSDCKVVDFLPAPPLALRGGGGAIAHSYQELLHSISSVYSGLPQHQMESFACI